MFGVKRDESLTWLVGSKVGNDDFIAIMSFIPLAKSSFEPILHMLKPKGKIFYENQCVDNSDFRHNHGIRISERFKLSAEDPDYIPDWQPTAKEIFWMSK